MAIFPNINMPDTGDDKKDLTMYKIELERRLRHYLSHISNESLVLGLAANRIIQTDAAGNLDTISILSNWILGTSGNIVVTDNGNGTVTLSVIGSISNITEITITTTITIAQQGVIKCNSATAIDVDLPTAIGNDGLKYSISNVNSGIVTIDPFGTETLQSDLSFDLYEDESLNIISDGANWIVGG